MSQPCCLQERKEGSSPAPTRIAPSGKPAAGATSLGTARLWTLFSPHPPALGAGASSRPAPSQALPP